MDKRPSIGEPTNWLPLAVHRPKAAWRPCESLNGSFLRSRRARRRGSRDVRPARRLRRYGHESVLLRLHDPRTLMRQIVSEDRGVIDRVGQESVGGVGLQAPEVADYGSPRRVLARRPLIMRPKQIFGSTLAWGYDGCMRLSIDATRRQGHGRCYEFAPEVIRPNDEGMQTSWRPLEMSDPRTRRLSRLSSGTGPPRHRVTKAHREATNSPI